MEGFVPEQTLELSLFRAKWICSGTIVILEESEWIDLFRNNKYVSNSDFDRTVPEQTFGLKSFRAEWICSGWNKNNVSNLELDRIVPAQ